MLLQRCKTGGKMPLCVLEGVRAERRLACHEGIAGDRLGATDLLCLLRVEQHLGGVGGRLRPPEALEDLEGTGVKPRPAPRRQR